MAARLGSTAWHICPLQRQQRRTSARTILTQAQSYTPGCPKCGRTCLIDVWRPRR